MAATGAGDCRLIIHDAVRPLLNARIIRECSKALHTYDAVDVAIASADTIIEVDDQNHISSIPPRSRMRRGQTPQAFRKSTLEQAYALAAHDPAFSATDDCGVVLKYLPEVPIKVVEGAEDNIKITHPVDFFIADKLFQLAAQLPTIEYSDDEYADLLRGRTIVVLGGSYGIGAGVADLAEGFGADVFRFARSTTETHVDRPADIEKALATAFDVTGRVDFVVLTAGILKMTELERADDATIEESVRVNYLAPIYVARAALPYLERTGGQLLLYTSSSYTRGRAHYSLYSSAKAAVVKLTQALSEEWATKGVRINCINPERTRTPMRLNAFGEENPDTLLTLDQVARTSLDVLLSDLTGQVVDIRRP